MMTNSLSRTDLSHVLTLIEEAHTATTTHALRRKLIFGVGALLESISCAWTELDSDTFNEPLVTTTIAETTDDQVDMQDVVSTFNQFAYQHPVIAKIINTEHQAALSFSDLVSRSEFNKLEL